MTDKHERLSTIRSLQLGFYACSELIGKPGGFRARERMPPLNDE
jgi:hypothetical protein